MRSDNGLTAFLKTHKKAGVLLFLLLLCGVLLLLGGRGGGEETATATATEKSETERYLAALTAETESFCSSVRGVGRCRVMITLASGEECVYRGSTKISSVPPRVLAVSVVCEGGGSDRVRRELSALLSSLFDIGENRVTVLRSK